MDRSLQRIPLATSLKVAFGPVQAGSGFEATTCGLESPVLSTAAWRCRSPSPLTSTSSTLRCPVSLQSVVLTVKSRDAFCSMCPFPFSWHISRHHLTLQLLPQNLSYTCSEPGHSLPLSPDYYCGFLASQGCEVLVGNTMNVFLTSPLGSGSQLFLLKC